VAYLTPQQVAVLDRFASEGKLSRSETVAKMIEWAAKEIG
jgi:hypothetical protein